MTESAGVTTERDFTWRSYRYLMSAFLDKGYRFCRYADLDPSARHIVLRHDVDFSISAARDIARIEADMGISAHYYVLLQTEFYNLCSPADWDALREIRDLGHEIGLHFDAAQYSDDLSILEAAAELECDILEKIIAAPVNTISFHRPAKSLQGLDQTLAGRLHTYQPQFFSDIAYVSDSQGAFRFGHPLDHGAFKTGRAIQLLTHPIWWTLEIVADRITLIDHFLRSRATLLQQEASANCKPYAARIASDC